MRGAGTTKSSSALTSLFRGTGLLRGAAGIGDGDGSLIEHIRGYHEYYAQDESWKNHVLHHDGPEAWEADKAQREMLLTEFVPYMQYHCNLSRLEQEAQTRLASGDTLTPRKRPIMGRWWTT